MSRLCPRSRWDTEVTENKPFTAKNRLRFADFRKTRHTVAQLRAGGQGPAKTARETRLAQIASQTNTNFPEKAQLSTFGLTFQISEIREMYEDAKNLPYRI